MPFTLEQEGTIFSVRAKLLLLLNEETHSVRTASDMMAMSISKARDTLNKLESALNHPLLLRRQGEQKGNASAKADSEPALQFTQPFRGVNSLPL